jgi:hypothetical protein
LYTLLFVGVLGEVVKVGAEGLEVEASGAVGHGPDGIHLVAVHTLYPVGPHLHVQPGELGLVDAAADAVRRLQDDKVGDPSLRQPLPGRDAYKTYVKI